MTRYKVGYKGYQKRMKRTRPEMDRMKNITVHGINEAEDTSPFNRKSCDIKEIQNILRFLQSRTKR